jgi:hypothetical protein
MNQADLETIIEAKVTQFLAERLGLHTPEKTGRQWYRPSEAAKLLDLENPDNLHDLRLAGDLVKGHHWRDISAKNAKRPTYQYHVGSCRAFLESRRN